MVWPIGRMLAVALMCAAALPAQHLNVGVRAGVLLTDVFDVSRSIANGGFTSETKRFTLGPMIDIRLPLGLGLEFDALYKRFDYAATSTTNTTTSGSGNSWEFPLIAKYRFPGVIAHPYVGAGFTFNKLSDVPRFFGAGGNEARSDSRRGFVAAVGIDAKVGIRLQPEIRYTYWGSEPISSVGDIGKLVINKNQAEFLLGISF